MEQFYKNSIVVVLLVLCAGFFTSVNAQSKQHLYTDRDYCLSGDTVWFKVYVPEQLQQQSNVVRVQFSNVRGSVISSIAVKSEQSWAEGFLHVPDSASSGVYSIMAFLNVQRQDKFQELEAKTVFVYNRFSEDIKEIEVPEDHNFLQSQNNPSAIEILTPKKIYRTREKVNGSVRIKSDNISNAVLSVKVVDPLANKHGGYVKAKLELENEFIPSFAEKDGVLISGKILNKEGVPQKNVLTLLSISSEPPYFDYYLSDEQGSFHFFLKQSLGKADVVLQAIDDSGNEFEIVPKINSLQTKTLNTATKVLNPEQESFIENMVQANFIHKLFYASKIGTPKYFEMPPRYDVPFYGEATKRVVPNEFFDLPDFREISRELLVGVQYRTRNDNATIRLVNRDQSRFFDEEPFRLLNGIPIFKNSLYRDLKSTDIAYIDIVEEERIFGDLRFQGVFAISLYDKSNAWIAQQPNIIQVEIPCLQQYRFPAYANHSEKTEIEPDFRQNFLWKELPETGSVDFQLQLSDVKGVVEIVVEGHTKTNEYFKTSKLIQVQ